MWKPYKSYKEIPEKEQQDICQANDVDKITDVPLETINSFYKGLEKRYNTEPKHYNGLLKNTFTSIKNFYKSYGD